VHNGSHDAPWVVPSDGINGPWAVRINAVFRRVSDPADASNRADVTIDDVWNYTTYWRVFPFWSYESFFKRRVVSRRLTNTANAPTNDAHVHGTVHGQI
jgi:hypothetical protein